jgi:hypothetical protein
MSPTLSTLARLSHVARTNPAALGKWGTYLAAAAARGPEALGVAHHLLAGHDADYSTRVRAAMRDRQNERCRAEDDGR